MTRYIEERREVFGVEPICRTLGVLPPTEYEQLNYKTDNTELVATT
jgi:hypothetical protein